MEHLHDNINDKPELRNNSRRASLAINIFWAISAINLMAVISGYFEVELLERIKDGKLFTDREIIVNDLRQAIVGLFQSGLYIASIVLFFNWFRRAYGNLHRMRIKNLKYSETMAIWSFVIPIISLYRPYEIAKEILIEVHTKLKELIPDYKEDIKTLILGIWWTLFLLSSFIGQFALRSIFKDDTIEQLITSGRASMVSDFLDIPVAIVTLLMIKQISKKEKLLYENIECRGFNK